MLFGKKWWIVGMVSLALAGMTLAAYWPVRHHEFVGLDDPDYVTENPEIKGGLTKQSIHWAFTEAFSSNWHPVTWMSHMLDCQLFGLNPKGPHLENVGWHIINSLLVLIFLSKTTGAFWRSAFVAGLFALHPAHVESVAWVAERKDVLSTFFGMGCLLAYAGYVRRADRGQETGDRRRVVAAAGFYFLALVLFALGLMSKPMLVTWPFLLLVVDFWPLQRIESLNTARTSPSADPLIQQPVNPSPQRRAQPSILRLLLEKVPLLGLVAGSCLLTMWAQTGAISTFEMFPLKFRIINALMTYIAYIGKLFWPAKLSVFYRFGDELTFGMAVVPVLLLSAITVVAWVARRSRPYLLAGWLWYLGTLVPVIGIIQVGSQSMADRYTYIPSIGLFVAVTWLLADLWASFWVRRKPLKRLEPSEAPASTYINVGVNERVSEEGSGRPFYAFFFPSVAAAVLLVCAGLTFRQAQVWRTSRSLFEHARNVTARNFLAAAVLGRLLQMEGKNAEALENFRLATSYAPDYPAGWYGMGSTLFALGKREEGEQAFQQGMRLNPEDLEGMDSYGLALLNAKEYAKAEPAFEKVLELRPNYAEGHLHLAMALEEQKKMDAALEHYKKATEFKPESFNMRYSYAEALRKQKKMLECIPEYDAALRIQPKNIDAGVGLGAALIETAQWDRAAEAFSAVLKNSPTNSSALDGLGYAIGMRGKPEEAFPYFVKAAEASPSNAFPRFHMAMEYERRNDIPKAIDALRAALRVNPEMIAACNDLSWLLATSADAKFRNGEEAVRMGEQACKKTNYSEPLFIGTLAAAYAEAGRFDDAIRAAEKAMDLAKKMGLDEVVRRNGELLKLYREHKPYHEPK